MKIAKDQNPKVNVIIVENVILIFALGAENLIFIYFCRQRILIFFLCCFSRIFLMPALYLNWLRNISSYLKSNLLKNLL